MFELHINMLFVLLALFIGVCIGQEQDASKKKTESGPKNETRVRFEPHESHQYGFDDFSDKDGKHSYMSLRISSQQGQYWGYCNFVNDKSLDVNFAGPVGTYSFGISGCSTPTTSASNSGTVSVSTSSSNEGTVDVVYHNEENNRDETLNSLNINAYEIQRVRLLLVEVDIKRYDGVSQHGVVGILEKGRVSSLYSCFKQAIVRVKADRIPYLLPSFRIYDVNNQISRENLDLLKDCFFEDYSSHSKYDYIQFEVNVVAKGLCGLGYTPGRYSFIFPCKKVNNELIYLERSYPHELGHNFGCRDNKAKRYSSALMYGSIKEDDQGCARLSYDDWKTIRDRLMDRGTGNTNSFPGLTDEEE